ncbi:MAG TPA: hypothetical protein PLG31_11740 [Spirochaetota bacterium]|nr:hypothetical protein [Spirochaetota bacterium]
MIAMLQIGMSATRTFELGTDLTDFDAQNKYVCRSWLKNLKFRTGEEMTVTFYEGNEVIERLTLRRSSSSGRTVYTSKNDTGGLYCWATLTAGLGSSWGFTAGLYARRKKRPFARDEARRPRDIQPSLW